MSERRLPVMYLAVINLASKSVFFCHSISCTAGVNENLNSHHCAHLSKNMASPIHENCGSLPSSDPGPVDVPVLQTPTRARCMECTKMTNQIIALEGVICMLLVFILLVPLIVIGYVYIEDCPKYPFAPRGLVGFGVAGIVAYYSTIIAVCVSAVTQSGLGKNIAGLAGLASFFFSFAFGVTSFVMFAGAVFAKDTVVNDSNVCHPAVKNTVIGTAIWWSIIFLMFFRSFN